MKLRSRKPLAVYVCAALAGLTLSGAYAADMPKRKSGLWEMAMHMEGMPNMGPMQQCVDQSSDDIMKQSAEKTKPDCSVMDIKPQGNKVTIHTVCKMEGTTVTTDAVFTGAFDSSYKGEMVMRYAPPMHGMSENKMSFNASWKGPCKPGQKPGDVIMPKMPGMDALMNDPEMREMMKKQRQQ